MELLFLIDLPDFSSGEMWISLVTLCLLEVILGVDNIIFISIVAGKLKDEDVGKATNIGLVLAMVMRIALLFGVTWLIAMNEPWLKIDTSWLHAGFSIQSLILIAGGLFLLYKSVSEIHHKLEGDEHGAGGSGKAVTLRSAIMQIAVINIVFSFDSILTAVGMTNGLDGALFVMIVAVVISVIIMMLFATPVGRFVNKHPTVQMLGLSFLILIGFMLMLEGGHLGHLSIFGKEIGAVPKGYLYFAIAFALGVEFLNIKLRSKKKPVQLHGVQEEAVKEGIL